MFKHVIIGQTYFIVLQTVTASSGDFYLCNVDMKQYSPEIISILGEMALAVTQHIKLARGRFCLPNDGMQNNLTHANTVPLQLSGLQRKSS